MVTPSPLLLSIDAGTTHCKAALFDLAGNAIARASRTSPLHRTSDGSAFYDPEEFWLAVVGAVREVTAHASGSSVAAVGVSSMAESGLLIDRRDGSPRSAILPWFDTSATPQSDQTAATGDPESNFRSKGIYPSFKTSLAKILWLRQAQGVSMENAVWLPVAGYLVFRLTGASAADPSLAGRTYAYDINRREWDAGWLAQFDLPVDLFPNVLPSGSPAGSLHAGAAGQTGLPAGIPAVVCGHDHVCGALAATAGDPAVLFDSMGTAEALVGAFDRHSLGRREYESGLSFGCHVLPGMNYWMGGVSSSGGSIEWLRSILSDPALEYEDLERLYDSFTPGPGGILYFPYLTGSGSPNTDPLARAAFIGLRANHRRADLLKAVLEGTAYEAEIIRAAAERIAGHPFRETVAAGGGARNPAWIQIKADVSGTPHQVPSDLETTLRGAAILSAAGTGTYPTLADALAAMQPTAARLYQPDPACHQAYRREFKHGYMRLQQPLRSYYRYRSEDIPHD